MSKSPPANAQEPIFDAAELSSQTHGLIAASTEWLREHWLQILIAFAIGTVIVLGLHALRRVGEKLCDRPHWAAGWGVVLGRTVSRTGNIFIVMLAAKLVVGYAGAPEQVESTINFLFTIATVFQAAIWARELILGSIEHRTSAANYQGEALLSAMGLIRLLVTFALFAIALVVVLDNLGVNVTGLVAGLGVGGIAIGSAASP